MADDAEEAAAVRDAIASVLDVTDNGRVYPNRSGVGVRRYVEVRVLEGGPRWAHAVRADRDEVEGSSDDG